MITEPPEKGRVTKKQDYTYSTSVPISVPLWGRRSVTAKDEDDDVSNYLLFYSSQVMTVKDTL